MRRATARRRADHSSTAKRSSWPLPSVPQEGPCECDLYLTCAKFVTAREYAPRLRSRRRRGLELVEDAAIHGWAKDVERHRCTVRRLEQLLAELDEPINGLEVTA